MMRQITEFVSPAKSRVLFPQLFKAESMDTDYLIVFVQENISIYSSSQPEHRDRSAVSAIREKIGKTTKGVSFHIKKESYVVYLGGKNLRVSETKRVTVVTRRSIIHPQFELLGLKHDVALIDLHSPVSISAWVGVVTLPLKDLEDVTYTDQNMLLTAWGSHHVRLQDRVQYFLNTSLVSAEECSRVYVDRIQSNHICAVMAWDTDSCFSESGTTVFYEAFCLVLQSESGTTVFCLVLQSESGTTVFCEVFCLVFQSESGTTVFCEVFCLVLQSESGSPIVTQEEDISTLIGLLSFNDHCSDDPFHPGVASKVSYYLSWILMYL
uniref:Peptidase S1 domain-containing protein n=1 Tax=Timema genevievae TaxID=629358 RepID=A0A7R9PRU6_TIMGE|nr:unnamed protein product [Timema genevievae]